MDGYIIVLHGTCIGLFIGRAHCALEECLCCRVGKLKHREASAASEGLNLAENQAQDVSNWASQKHGYPKLEATIDTESRQSWAWNCSLLAQSSVCLSWTECWTCSDATAWRTLGDHKTLMLVQAMGLT